MRLRMIWGWAVVVLIGVAPVRAEAQVATAEVARRLVGEGIEAARSRDWLTARDKFAQAYKIQPLPLTLYNLAAAQEKSGQFVESDRSYRIFLRETASGEHESFRKAAVGRRGKLRERIAYVVVEVENIAPNDELRLGEQTLAHAVLGESVPTNPGKLLVEVRRAGAVAASKEVVLPDGGSQRVMLRMDPITVVPSISALPDVGRAAPNGAGNPLTTTTGPPPAQEEGGLLSSPVFWGVLVGVAVLGGGAAVYFGTRPGDPYESTLEAVTIRGR